MRTNFAGRVFHLRKYVTAAWQIGTYGRFPMPSAQPHASALLKADNRKVEDLFEKVEGAKGAVPLVKKQRLVKQICTELMVHTIIEEQIFYPACREDARRYAR
jgi:hypothetical protein